MSKLGLNSVLGSVRDYARWLRVLRGMKKSTVHTIVTGGVEFEKERQDVIRIIEEVGRSDCLYVHRYFRPEQGNWSLPGVSAKTWTPIYKKIARHPQIITEIPINEPSQSEHPDFVKLQVDHLKAANDAGHALGLAVQGVGGPDEGYIISGGFDAMYKAIAAANQGSQRMAYLHKHEYRWGWAECGAGFDDVPYRAMLSPQVLETTMKLRHEWSVRKGRWLTRTTDWEAVHVRDTLGIDLKYFPVIHTEWGNDGVDDPINKLNQMMLWNYELTALEADTLGISRDAPHWRVSMFADRLRDKFLRPPANGLRGWGAWRLYYEKVFPNMRWEEISRLLMHHDNYDILWPDYIVGATYFVWAFHGEWGGETGSSRHNFGEEGLDDVLIEAGSWDDNIIINPTPNPEPIPVPVPVEKFDERYVRSTISQGTNIRAAADIRSEIIGKLPYEGLIAFVSQSLVAGGEYQWRKLVIGDLVGYAADDFLDFDYLTKEVTITLSWQQIKSLRKQIDSL